jgi:hypothetical protein
MVINMIETVKLLKDVNGTLTGYMINGVRTVPLAEGNSSYKSIQEWLAKGNTPEEAS